MRILAKHNIERDKNCFVTVLLKAMAMSSKINVELLNMLFTSCKYIVVY